MKGMRGGMANFIKQANQMQNKINKIKEELDAQEFEGSSGGGAVSVTVTGEGRLTKLDVNDDVFSEGDKEMLQDLILTATNEALKTAQETRDKAMEKVTGGMSLPGLGF
mgnify:CR=1 FL=1